MISYCHIIAVTLLKKFFLSLTDHLLPPYTCPDHLNTIIRFSSLIRLYDGVLPCLFNYHLLVKQCFFFYYFVTVWLIKYVIFFISFLHVSWYLFKFILAISLDLCHDFWSCTFCHGNHIIPVPPPPRPHPRPLVFRLTRLNKSCHDARCHHLHCFVGFDPSHQCSFRWISCLKSGLLFQFSLF